MPAIPDLLDFDPDLKSVDRPLRGPGVTTRKMLCATCDIACNVVAEVKNERVVRIRASDNPAFRDNICMKGVHAPKEFAHPNRVLHPLRRVGERGSGQMGARDLGRRPRRHRRAAGRVIERYGPEGFAVSTSQWNTSAENGACRRFMNLLGSPNWISGVALCAGNTAAINRMVYGWFPLPRLCERRNCIVLFGHNPKKHSWTPDLQRRSGARRPRGAKLIVLDPRRSENAERPTCGCRCGPARTPRCASAGSTSSSKKDSTTATSSSSGRSGSTN